MTGDSAMLVLVDGTVFDGKPFGKVGEAVGETVFYTGVVGYQEVLTDPSYGGTLTTFTYPIIGSYGVNDEDNETPQVHPRGVVIKEYSRTPSNFRSTGTLEDFLVTRGVVGIRGVDTRALVVHLRDHGEMMGMIVSGDVDTDAALAKLKATSSPWASRHVGMGGLEAPAVPKPEGKPKHRLVALSTGIKRSTLTTLARLGCAVKIVPVATTPDKVLKLKAGGLLLDGGPGDPNAAKTLVETVKTLLGRIPILGIGLGSQVLALALGCTVERMKAGHHGVNYSVKRAADDKGEITVQHHSFVVSADVPADVEVTHVNVNDGTVEGVRSTKHPAWSVQFHPSNDDWNRPNRVYTEFLENL
ncbi:MAG TPA: glutamine-hydrolyzing carbamoyl-phosphate synthase small subunit [Planctomycetota bacterium]|nr:glutamine-hydrolyzing carbamoyl-phosphate synthase small subunit [Planctomycetota bacterium]